jgi:hypothetical protein
MTEWLTLNRLVVCLYDVLTTQGFVTDKTSATDNMPQSSQDSLGMSPYGMEYQVVAESALVG